MKEKGCSNEGGIKRFSDLVFLGADGVEEFEDEVPAAEGAQVV